jgi:hypothetical protein
VLVCIRLNTYRKSRESYAKDAKDAKKRKREKEKKRKREKEKKRKREKEKKEKCEILQLHLVFLSRLSRNFCAFRVPDVLFSSVPASQ